MRWVRSPASRQGESLREVPVSAGRRGRSCAVVAVSVAALLTGLPLATSAQYFMIGSDAPAIPTEAGIVIGGAFARATLPGAPVAAGFLTIRNHGETDDILRAARTPAAGRAEFHETVAEGNVVRMRPLADGLRIPAGGTVSLAPGGTHLMFFDLAGPLVAGEKLPLILGFDLAGEIVVHLHVGPPTADGPHGDH